MIPTHANPADRRISFITYEDIVRNDYENLTLRDRMRLVQHILSDLNEAGVEAFTPGDFLDPIYAYRCARHCHANICDVEGAHGYTT